MLFTVQSGVGPDPGPVRATAPEAPVPTATQAVADTHEAPARFEMPAGRFSLDHVDPVPEPGPAKTTAPADPPPTAMQPSTDAHETSVSSTVPEGRVATVHEGAPDPGPSTIAASVPPEVEPAATHEVLEVHATADRSHACEGAASLVQAGADAPGPERIDALSTPEAVDRYPTAMHEVAVAHDTPLRSSTPGGAASMVHAGVDEPGPARAIAGSSPEVVVS
jgi:hypothetical protein